MTLTGKLLQLEITLSERSMTQTHASHSWSFLWVPELKYVCVSLSLGYEARQRVMRRK